MMEKIESKEKLTEMLRAHGINPTSQRVALAHALFARGEHLSADQLFALVNVERSHVSKATVYNSLALFVKKGLIREVIADPNRTFYDPNTAPHHHFFDVDTGELIDIDGSDVDVSGLPPLPQGTELDGIDVVVRLRHTR